MTQPIPDEHNPIAAVPGSADELPSVPEQERPSAQLVETPQGDGDAAPELGFEHASKKVRSFPQSPGVYLMKDRFGRVIYIGKAKNLRSRAGSYFLKAAAVDQRTADWI